MAITPKQENFAQAIASGMNQSDAYRSAYSAGGMKSETVQQAASRVMADSKVSARVSQLRDALQAKALWTRERSVLALADIADGSESKANEKVAAIKELNLMHGFNAPIKHELNGAFTFIEHRIVRPSN